MAGTIRRKRNATSQWKRWHKGTLPEEEAATLPSTLLRAKCWTELIDLLADFAYPVTRIRAGNSPAMIRDYDVVLENWAGPESPAEPCRSGWTCRQILRDWRNFIVDYRRHIADGHVDPAVLAWNRADSGPVTEAAQRNLESQPPAWRLFLTQRPPLCIDTPEFMAAECSVPIKIQPVEDGETFLVWTDQSSLHRINSRDGSSSSPIERCGWIDAFGSLSPDGARYYVPARHESFDGIIRAWSTISGEMLWECQELKPISWPYSIGSSPDGARLVVTAPAEWQGMVRLHLLDAGSGKLLRYVETCEHQIRGVMHHSDRRRIFVHGKSGRVYLWDLVAGETRLLTGSGTNCELAALAPDGGCLATASLSKVRRCDLRTGKWSTAVNLPGESRPIAFSRDLQRIALSNERAITVVDVISGKTLACFSYPDSSTWMAGFSNDRSVLAAAFYDAGVVRFWRLDRGYTPHRLQRWHRKVSEQRRDWHYPVPVGMMLEIPIALTGHERLVDRFIFRERGISVWVFEDGFVAVCSIDGGVCLRSERYNEENPERRHVFWAATNADGTRLALNIDTLWVIDLETMGAMSRYYVSPIDEYNQHVLGDLLYTLDSAGRVCCWDLRSENFQHHVVELPDTLAVPMIELSREGRHVIVCDCYGLILLFDAAAGERLASAAELHRVRAVWMNDGRMIPDTSGGGAYQLRRDLPWKNPVPHVRNLCLDLKLMESEPEKHETPAIQSFGLPNISHGGGRPAPAGAAHSAVGRGEAGYCVCRH